MAHNHSQGHHGHEHGTGNYNGGRSRHGHEERGDKHGDRY